MVKELKCGGIVEVNGKCQMIKCTFNKDGKCADETKYISRYTGKPICRYHYDAIPGIYLEVAPELYEALKALVTLRDKATEEIWDMAYRAIAKAEGREVR